jgi:hypothetical protein
MLRGNTKRYTGGKNQKLAGFDQLSNSTLGLAKSQKMNQSSNTSLNSLSDDSNLDNSVAPTEFSMFSSVHKEVSKEIDLRKIYIQNYGVKMEFPAYYI